MPCHALRHVTQGPLWRRGALCLGRPSGPPVNGRPRTTARLFFIAVNLYCIYHSLLISPHPPAVHFSSSSSLHPPLAARPTLTPHRLANPHISFILSLIFYTRLARPLLAALFFLKKNLLAIPPTAQSPLAMACPFARITPPATPPPAHSAPTTLCSSARPLPPSAKDRVIPRLQDYSVDPVYGFLPVNPHPISRLADPYGPWEHVMDNLNTLLLAGKLRSTVENVINDNVFVSTRRQLLLISFNFIIPSSQLPLLTTDSLSDERQWQRAYLVLSFIAQAYVWGHEQKAAEVLPITVAKPWHACAQHLGILPIITYASVTLYNYHLIDPKGPLELNNMDVMHTFTGSDEAWFYLISIASEAVGAPALSAILTAMHAVQDNDIPTLIASLKTISSAIAEITKVMMRMYERNDPQVFYTRVRHYLTGWEDSSALPNGVFYEGVENVSGEEALKCPVSGRTVPQKSTAHLRHYAGRPLHGSYGKYAGASTGQSSMMHCLDVALGIEHKPTRAGRCTASNFDLDALKAGNVAAAVSPPSTCPATSQASPPAPINHILEMRKYMPGPHRAFIQALERGPSIRHFVDDLVHRPALDANGNCISDPALVAEASKAYNKCVDEMRGFRDRHLQIVASYIVLQARRKKDAEAAAGAPTTLAAETVRLQEVCDERASLNRHKHIMNQCFSHSRSPCRHEEPEARTLYRF